MGVCLSQAPVARTEGWAKTGFLEGAGLRELGHKFNARGA